LSTSVVAKAMVYSEGPPLFW